MTPAWRTALLFLALFALAPAFWRVGAVLPPFGHPVAAYGEVVNALLPHLRNVPNMVAAVNFDVRGIDTLGEESMLICAVVGAVVLLRGARGEAVGERAVRLPGRARDGRTDATVLACRVAAGITVLFGLYMALHGTVTPGGGFQGGVVIASGFVLIYLGEGYGVWRTLLPGPVLAALEGGGGLVFVLAAGLPLLFSHPALANLIPLGTWKDLYSGGMMVVANLAVATAVTASFGLLLLEFMEETRVPQREVDETTG